MKVRLDDGQIMRVTRVGRGRPCVMLPGFAMKSWHWATSVLPLTTRHEFILPDFRGFGRSRRARFTQADILTQLAQDVLRLVETFDQPVAFAGISMGAGVAMRYHELYGFDGVERYMHIDQAPCMVNKPDWEWGLFGAQHAQMMQRFETLHALAKPLHERGATYAELPAHVRAMFWEMASMFFQAAISEPYQKHTARVLMSLEPFRRFMLPMSNWRAYFDCMSAYAHQGYDMRASVQRIDIPVTLAVGMKSHMYPAQGQLWMSQHIPQAKVVRFERSGHTIPLTEPIAFTRALGAFLDE